MAKPLDPNQIKVYRPKRSKQWRFGAFSISLVVVGIWSLTEVWAWHVGGPMPRRPVFTGLGILCIPFGIILLVSLLRGYPRLTITPEGVCLDRGLGPRTATWNNLDPFEVKTIYKDIFKRQVLMGSAQIIGSGANRVVLRRKSFSIPDFFETPIVTIVAELNAERTALLGRSRSAIVASPIDRS
jgi:hypothetical protein